MAAVMTGDRITVEDLSPAMGVLDMRQTPFYARMKKGKALENHLLYSQAVDTMGKRRKGGVPERQDVKAFEGGKSERLYGRGERFQRTPAVSKEAQKFSGASASTVLKDYNAQVTQKIIETKRDINYTILSDQESQDDDGITGYFFRAIGRWINDGTTGAATATGGASVTSGTADLAFNDTTTAIPSNMRTPAAQIYAGALTDLKEDDLNDIMQNRWAHAGVTQDFTLWCAAGLKGQISKNFGRYVANKEGFTAITRSAVAPADQGKLVTSGIDIFEGDYGTITIELEPWMPTTQRGYGCDMAEVMLRPAYLAEHSEFEDKGGGRRGLIDSILGAWFGDPRKHFKICPSSEVAAVVDFDF